MDLLEVSVLFGEADSLFCVSCFAETDGCAVFCVETLEVDSGAGTVVSFSVVISESTAEEEFSTAASSLASVSDVTLAEEVSAVFDFSH